jgi:hypothetical protein
MYKFVSCVPYYRRGNKIQNHTVRTVPKSNRKILEIKGKIPKEKYHTVRTVPKSNRKIVERGKLDTSNTQIQDCSL